MSDLRQLFNDFVRFEIEVWNDADAPLKSKFGLPLTHYEPMSVIGRLPGATQLNCPAVNERYEDRL